MKDIRKKFNLWMHRHANQGIPNLMLIICIGTLVMYLFMLIDRSNTLYRFLCFNRSLILQGQIWRLITYIFIPNSSGIWLFLLLFCYYSIGRMLEGCMGTLRFTMFYFCGVLLMDLGALLLGTTASTYYLHLSLFLALATMFPDNRVLLFYIIPIKMKYLAWVYLALAVYDTVQLDFSALIALLNWVIFFSANIRNVLPGADRVGAKTMSNPFKKRANQNRPNPNWASAYQKRSNSSASTSGSARKIVDQPAYHHKCTICGKTDVSDPALEFRYCSKCHGYYCYCQDHISNHAHITE